MGLSRRPIPLSWIPVLLLLVAMLCLRGADLQGAYEGRFLTIVMNFITGTLASVLIAYLAGRSFLGQGSPGVLLLGCGALAWGAAGLVANSISRGEPNLDVTIHNCSVWVSGLFHLAGAVWLLQPRRTVRGTVAWMGIAYVGALGAVGLVVLWALQGHPPMFFVPGMGGTLVRQFVLGSAIFMFFLAALLIARSSRGTKSSFPHWYILALAAIAVGLLGLLLQTTIGGLLPWTGRLAMWLGGAYMVLAALAAMREAGVWGGRLQDALRASEKRFASLARQAPVGIFETDAQGDCLFVNEWWQDIAGLSAAEAAGKGWTKAIHPDDQQRVFAEWYAAAQAQREFASEYRFRTPTGKVIWAVGHAKPVRDASGTLVGYLGTVLDITARKHAEEALSRAKELSEAANRISTVLHSTLDAEEIIKRIVTEGVAAVGSETAAISLRDADGWRVRYAHGMPPGLMGMVLDDKQERHAVMAVETAEVVAVADAFNDERFDREHLRRHNVRSVLVAPLISRGGVLGVIFFNYHAAPHVFSEAELNFARQLAAAAASALQNASWFEEQKRAQEALHQLHQRLQYHAQNTPLAVVEFDAELRISAWSDGAQRIFGWEASEAVGRRMWEFPWICDEDREKVRTISGALVSGQTVRSVSPNRNLRKDGKVIWCEWYNSSLADAAGKMQSIQSLVLDVTERKEAEEALQAAQQQLRQHADDLEKTVGERTAKLQELVGDLEHFSYTLTHDLRAPLRAMRGFGEMASDLCADCEHANRKDFVRRIMISAERMDHLIADALQYTRSVRQELPIAQVDTGALLRGILDSYPELQAAEARITIQGELPLVMGNAAGLTQCFSNLLANAVKFVKLGEMPEICIRADQREGWARIWIEDKGIGISKQMLPRVFDMFSRGSTSYEGTGIGLALVRKVAQRMGGRVGVESEEGQGSRFWLELKCGETKPAPAKAVSASSEAHGGTVLYVEDEESDALFMQTAFMGKGLGAALRVAGNGRVAIDYLSGAGKYTDRQQYPSPKVVLLDLNLPEVSGFEVLRWMRNHPDFAATPVVMFSSSNRENDKAKAGELGANDFLEKPSSGVKFADVVEELRRKWHI